MNKLVVVVAVLVAVAFGFRLYDASSSKTRAHRACENVAKQCEDLAKMQGGSVHWDRVDECGTALEGELERSEAFDQLTDCMLEATSCGDVLRCGNAARLRELR